MPVSKKRKNTNRGPTQSKNPVAQASSGPKSPSWYAPVMFALMGLGVLRRAQQGVDVPMPGYTHLQRAVPSSVGLWMAGFAEAFIDNLELACSIADLMDSSPLGCRQRTAHFLAARLELPYTRRSQAAHKIYNYYKIL